MEPHSLRKNPLLTSLQSTLVSELGKISFAVEEDFRITADHLESLYGKLPEPVFTAENILGGIRMGVEETATDARFGLGRCALDPEVRDWAKGLSNLPVWTELTERYGPLWCAGVTNAFEVALLLDARGNTWMLDLRYGNVDGLGPVSLAFVGRKAVETSVGSRQSKLLPPNEGILLSQKADFIPLSFTQDDWGIAWRNHQDGSILMHKLFLRAIEFSTEIKPERSWEAWCLWS